MMETYTQCKIQYEPFEGNERHEDTMWIPTKFAFKDNVMIVDKPIRRKAKVLEVFSTKEEVKRQKWDVGGL